MRFLQLPNFQNIFSVWRACSGYRWLYPQNECDLFAMARETYTDFQPNTDQLHTLYIDKNRMESKFTDNQTTN